MAGSQNLTNTEPGTLREALLVDISCVLNGKMDKGHGDYETFLFGILILAP